MAIAQDKNNLILSQKMDAVSALAMWEAARVNQSQQITITHHYHLILKVPSLFLRQKLQALQNLNLYRQYLVFTKWWI